MITTDAPEYEYLSLLPEKIQISGKWVCKILRYALVEEEPKKEKQ